MPVPILARRHLLLSLPCLLLILLFLLFLLLLLYLWPTPLLNLPLDHQWRVPSETPTIGGVRLCRPATSLQK